jgi:hypothetical protein
MPANEHLRKEWGSAGYSTGVGSAIVIPPPPKGFVPAYHFVSAEYGISNIVFGRLKVARFSDLNDPFELFAHSDIDINVRRLIAEHKSKLDATQGLLCFSADWVDPVLWTHYAVRHRGICLGFEIDEKLVKRVSYEKERMTGLIQSTSATIDKNLSDLLLATKFKSWEYERELRVLVDLAKAEQEGDLFFYKFGSQVRLTLVVLGSLCGLSVEAVRTFTKKHHPDAVAIQARLANKSFNVVPKERTIPPYPALT